jgi:hypothetical protein
MHSILNKNQGYYTVGDQLFRSKVEAFAHGTKTNTHPEWQFFNNEWKCQQWTQEPQVDITELYKARARQIREKYDWVTIFYSGGSDSQIMVDSFLEAGCRIDEIVTIWYRGVTGDPIMDRNATNAENIEAEFEFTTRPGLERIKNLSPHTKITYRDRSKSMVESYKQVDSEEWVVINKDVAGPSALARYSVAYDKDQLEFLDKGLKTAFVYGVDKPKVCIKDGNYCLYFIDSVINYSGSQIVRTEYNNYDEIYFYWSVDMPEIVIKQAHMIRNWFEMHPALKPILYWPNSNTAHRNAYEIIVRPIIYPSWDLNTFQVNKISRYVFHEWDNWWYTKMQGTKEYQIYNKGIKYVVDSVDKKYLQYTADGLFNGIVGMINGHFVLGPAATKISS